MKNLNRNKTSLFLMEMIVVILFFSVASAVCVQIFAYGEEKSRRSRDLTNAVIQVQNATQLIKSSNGTLEAVEEYYNIEAQNNAAFIYFDSAFKVCTEQPDANYVLEIIQEQNDTRQVSHLAFCYYKTREEIFQLDSEKYIEEGN